MTKEHLSSPASVARYGVPVVAGLFYLMASRGFDFTSEGTWAMAGFVKYGFSSPLASGSTSPLWEFFLAVGGGFHLDPLLTGKVLSLIFSCLTILVCSVVTYEIVQDYAISLCVTLIMAMQGWLLQIGPSGSPLSAAIALVLAVMFFMLRNEYVVAPFILGLCTLISWQVVVLLLPLWADMWFNSVSKRRAQRVMLAAALAYVAAVLPWAVYSAAYNRPLIPVIADMPELPMLTIMAALTMIVPGALGFAGLALVARGEARDRFRTSAGPLMFLVLLLVAGAASRSDIWYAAIPLVLVYAFLGLAEVLKRLRGQNLVYSLSFVLTGLLLIGAQRIYYKENEPSMAAAIGRAEELRTAGEWISRNVPRAQNVCAEHPSVVGYYAERAVASAESGTGSSCDLVVSSRSDTAGYERAFTPDTPVDAASAQRYVVWRRK